MEGTQLLIYHSPQINKERKSEEEGKTKPKRNKFQKKGEETGNGNMK
jgi:hypothetical protein